MDHPFRSAMFGGFNRQDVLEYLENSAQQAAQQQQELQAQLDQARQELTDRQSQESDGQEQLEKAQQEAEALQSQLDQANADLTISWRPSPACLRSWSRPGRSFRPGRTRPPP